MNELSGRAEAWRYVRLVRIARRISVEAIAKEARLRPETLVRFETGVGSGPALRRVKYAIERLLRAHPDDQPRS